MTCTVKHTQYQPNDTWRCPKCGITANEEGTGFYIESVVDGASDECELLHMDDECLCHTCGYQAYGKTVANRLKKLDNMITCPHCKGKGVIPNPDKG